MGDAFLLLPILLMKTDLKCYDLLMYKQTNNKKRYIDVFFIVIDFIVASA